MADALISIVLEQLASYVQSQVMLVVDVSEEVLKLTANLRLLQAVLVDADQKQVKDQAVRVWLEDLKQVVYDADDVLDEWLTRDAISQIQSDVHVTVGIRKKVLSNLFSPCFCFKHDTVRYDIGHQIKDINKRLDLISKQRTDFGLQVVHQIHHEPNTRRMTSSAVDVSKIRGRDQAKEDVMSRLLGETSSQGEALRVIAIVGIGGLGKTTLAKLIFNEERVVEIFKTKIWVCVSNPINLVGVAKAIIKEATSEDVQDSAEWEEVHKSLCEAVKGKQYLLVLDDVWTEDLSHWKQLKLALDGGAPGSRIIVTTRNQSVAKIMGSIDFDIHDLEKLSDEDSWSMLKDVALVGRDKELSKFEKMGREIAIKCKGVPLAITTLAGVLCERETIEEWKDVLRSDLWEMPQIEHFFLPSLYLSYYSLPSVSKQCFLYCAIFQKDEELKKDDLIRLWMAQGFFGFEERRDLERIGEDHFRVLAMRSFFQDFKKDSEGNITSCKMHDLVHDFSLHLSQNESSTLLEGDNTVSNCDKIRHLHFDDHKIPFIWNAKNLRTLFLGSRSAVPVEVFDNLTCLRTLQLSWSDREVLPDEVEKLVHLRYLDLSRNFRLLELPETICNLYNLQVLALNGCQKLLKLPEKIGKLSNLRHLEIEGTGDLSCFPKSIATLSSLRTLSKFIVSNGDRGCTIGDLQLLNNLRGALKLSGLSRVTDVNDAIRAELKKKVNLRQLTLCFEEETDERIEMKNVLENLEPNEDLEILEINGYSYSHFPAWVQSCSLLTNVVEMRLYGCNLCTELPALGKLGFLQTLEISGMRSVRRIGTDSEFYGFDDHQMTAFPKLHSLIIKDMAKLEEWEVPISKDRKIMPLLVEISLEKFPMLRALPCLGSLGSLERLKMEYLWSVKRIGDEFYGFDAQMIVFPKLDSLVIDDMEKLVKWEVPIFKDRKIMPLLVNIQINSCPMLRALPCLGSLESLKKLEMKKLSSVKRMGEEFYRLDAQMIAFPKLESLVIEDMRNLEEWKVPISKDRKIMPLLLEISLEQCPKLRALPCVGSLVSLERLKMEYLWSVKRIGDEFYGFDEDSSSLGVEMIAFPKLKTFGMEGFHKLEEWNIPISRNRKIMPILTELDLRNFPKLKALPCVWRMESLEKLRLYFLPSVERVGAEFGNEGFTFPKLKKLEIKYMVGIEEWSVPLIVPCLEELYLEHFSKLKTLPTFKECMKTLESFWIDEMPVWEGQEKLVIISDKEGSSKRGVGSCGLRCLGIFNCPKLRVLPDYMFSPSLQRLDLDGDVGDVYNTFLSYDTLCSITQVTLRGQPHSALPNGFHQLKALQSLEFYQCSTLDFDLKEELGNFIELQHLKILECPLLEERYKGDNWRTIVAHVPNISIDWEEITKK